MINKKYRKAVFIVTYSKTNKGIDYLLLKRKMHWNGWEFPKGGIEKNEKVIQTVKREVFEETGLVPIEETIRDFNFSGSYDYKKKYPDRPGYTGQSYVLFSVEVKKGKIKLSEEHSGYIWLKFEDALERLTFNNQKKCLKIVNDWVKNKNNKFREVMINSDTRLLLGKDEKSNDELMNSFKGKPNIILHTEARGSPFGVIEKLKPSKKEIYLSGVAVSKYSQAWRNNKKDVIVNVFSGKDASKKKSMKMGTWGVKSSKKETIKKEDIIKFEKKQNERSK